MLHSKGCQSDMHPQCGGPFGNALQLVMTQALMAASILLVGCLGNELTAAPPAAPAQMAFNVKRARMEERLAQCGRLGAACPPMTWTVSNRLAEFAPTVLRWFFRREPYLPSNSTTKALCLPCHESFWRLSLWVLPLPLWACSQGVRATAL